MFSNDKTLRFSATGNHGYYTDLEWKRHLAGLVEGDHWDDNVSDTRVTCSRCGETVDEQDFCNCDLF